MQKAVNSLPPVSQDSALQTLGLNVRLRNSVSHSRACLHKSRSPVISLQGTSHVKRERVEMLPAIQPSVWGLR